MSCTFYVPVTFTFPAVTRYDAILGRGRGGIEDFALSIHYYLFWCFVTYEYSLSLTYSLVRSFVRSIQIIASYMVSLLSCVVVVHPPPSQVGGLVIGESLSYYDGMSPCKDSDSDDSVDEIVLGVIVAGGAVILAFALGCFLRQRRNKKKTMAAMESDLNGFGANKASAGSSTL